MSRQRTDAAKTADAADSREAWKKSRKDLLLVCLTILPFMICTGIVYSVLSLYMNMIGLTKSQIGFLYTFGAVAGAAVSPFVGFLTDRVGRKRVLLSSMGLFSLVFFGYALTKRYAVLFLVQAGEGVAWAAMGVAATALVADRISAMHRGKAMGIYNMTWNLGWIIGPSLGGVLADRAGFHFMFFLCAGLTFLGLLFGVLCIPPAGGPGRNERMTAS